MHPVGNKGNHMHRLGKAILIAGALIVSVVALAALLLAIPATRPSVLGLAFRVIVWERGYHFASGVITFANHTLTITNLRIDDDRGEEFLAAKRLVVDIEPAGLIGRSDRLFGLHSVEVDEPASCASPPQRRVLELRRALAAWWGRAEPGRTAAARAHRGYPW